MSIPELDFYLRDNEHVSLSRRAEPALLIDDSAPMRKIVERLLNQLGIRDVDQVSDARAAFQQLHRRRYKVVICDVVMDGVTGIQLVKACRENPETAKLPFLMMTASMDPRYLAQAKGRAEGYILKPFTAEGLQRQLQEILPAPTEDDIQASQGRGHEPKVERFRF
ncbi:hypothetical protein SLNSH_19755 [Alsobacter soli]|uniref:Response regulatory domain-containing protein n=1 Tax=Alsobacter soli TaxID=2109933 RepID=A0A2T1HNT3_9HYPH|nr:response regulator [Alsobacter soli]PSC03293.1 hypothetical protein SLNSH_19755 [Alsobacter soli]